VSVGVGVGVGVVDGKSGELDVEGAALLVPSVVVGVAVWCLLPPLAKVMAVTPPPTISTAATISEMSIVRLRFGRSGGPGGDQPG
jgi:hypothetical protein